MNKENKWTDIESAPKDGTRILLFTDGVIDVGEWSTSCWADAGGSWIIYENRSDTIKLNPTHWLPLPMPPLP